MTLPKKVLRYIQPRDREHEARLAILWHGYLSCRKQSADGEMSAVMRALLGDVFGIPENCWHEFGPTPKRAPTMADLRCECRWLIEKHEQSLRSKEASKRQKPPKPQQPKKPVVILRKHSPRT